jgi:hypothetical protein
MARKTTGTLALKVANTEARVVQKAVWNDLQALRDAAQAIESGAWQRTSSSAPAARASNKPATGAKRKVLDDHR